MTVNRRAFLKGASVGVTAATLAGGVSSVMDSSANAKTPVTAKKDTASTGSVSMYGTHQAGILTPLQSFATFAAFDFIAGNRKELSDLFTTLTDRIHFLTAGGRPPGSNVGQPPLDSGILGPDVPADRLTATLGVGASLFDARYGLEKHKPRVLKPMTTFPNDNLNPVECHGDFLLQLRADRRDTVMHALRDITRHTRGGMQPRWKVDGFRSAPRPAGTPRNLMGFKDGIANPKVTDEREMNELVWVRPNSGEPPWAAGGTYQVVRIIRMLVEFWDRVSLTEQENMFGRRRDSGAPLDGNNEFNPPNYAKDPDGKIIPLDSHIRLANPRTADTASSKILRQGFNYDRGIDTNGNLDVGLIFSCYQQDLERQFETVQRRLIDEPLVDYIVPTGGGYFFVLPGISDRNDRFGHSLLAA